MEELTPADFQQIKLFVCRASIQNHVQTIALWTCPIVLFDIVKIAIEQSVVSGKLNNEFDFRNSGAYFVGLIEDHEVLGQLADVNSVQHARYILEKYNVPATSVNPTQDLRSLFESSSSGVIKLLLFPLLLDSRSSRRTMSIHAAYPGIECHTARVG